MSWKVGKSRSQKWCGYIERVGRKCELERQGESGRGGTQYARAARVPHAPVHCQPAVGHSRAAGPSRCTRRAPPWPPTGVWNVRGATTPRGRRIPAGLTPRYARTPSPSNPKCHHFFLQGAAPARTTRPGRTRPLRLARYHSRVRRRRRFNDVLRYKQAAPGPPHHITRW